MREAQAVGENPGRPMPEYTKKEKRACMYYHVAANSKELNQAGQYYAAHNHSLEGFAAKTAPAKK